MASTSAAVGEKKLPPPSPMRSVLAGSLAGGIEIGELYSPIGQRFGLVN